MVATFGKKPDKGSLHKVKSDLAFLQMARQDYFQGKVGVDEWLKEYSASLYAYALKVWQEVVDPEAESCPLRGINGFGILALEWSPAMIMELEEDLVEKGKVFIEDRNLHVWELYKEASIRLQDTTGVRITLMGWSGFPVAVGKSLEDQWIIWAGRNT